MQKKKKKNPQKTNKTKQKKSNDSILRNGKIGGTDGRTDRAKFGRPFGSAGSPERLLVISKGKIYGQKTDARALYVKSQHSPKESIRIELWPFFILSHYKSKKIK